MRLRLFRNATQRLRYAGHELLLDPYFAPKHSRPSYAGRSPNPLVDLPKVIERFRPDVIVTHSSGALWKGSGPIVMDAAQTLAVCRAAPESRVVAIQLDSLDHGEVSRHDLRAQARAARLPDERLLIPADGETLDL